MPDNFVFYDPAKHRWKSVITLLKRIFIVADITALGVLFSLYYVPNFNSLSVYESNYPKNVIDNISTQKKDIIEVEGYGPLVELTEKDGNYKLLRKDFTDNKTVILTFDDGPHPVYTRQILDALDKERVRAVFFMTGENMFRYPDVVRDVVDRGHQVGTHTYTHAMSKIDYYDKPEKVGFEIDFPQKILTAETGVKTKLIRIPYWGVEDTISLNTLVFTASSIKRGYEVLAVTIDSFDWRERDSSVIARNAVDTRESQVILMHDGGGDRSATSKAIPEIVSSYKRSGFSFTTVDALVDGSEKLVTMTGYFDLFAANMAYMALWFAYELNSMFDHIFIVGLVAVIISVTATLILATRQYIGTRKKKLGNYNPFVSVLIPAYNEEKSIAKTIRSLLKSDYKRYEIIVIDNNSSDETAEVVKQFSNNKRVRLIYQPIQGKYAALNMGMERAWGHIVVAIDADTQVQKDTLREIVKPFRRKNMGAVSGNIKVGNRNNILTKLQSIEYIVGLNLDRRAFDELGAIPVVPGALGAWRKSAVIKAGLYEADTLTEDADLAIKVQRMGYKIVFADRAIAYTEAPDTLKEFLRQRHRWTLGILQVLFKHRDMFFRSEYGNLGKIVMPYQGIFQLIFMLMAPFVDILAIILILTTNVPIILYLGIYLTIYYIQTSVAFIFAREKQISLLLLLPFMRIYYQIIWYYILYKAVITAVKGVYVPWNKLKHYGNVSLATVH